MAMGIGVIGAGDISSAYLEHLTSYPDVEVLVVGNRTVDTAREAAEKLGVPRWGSIEEVLAADDVELVVNLTIPAVHAQVTRDALQAGKHVWSEKPLATSLAESAELVQLAAERGLRLGCAPDTMLGPVLQQALRAFANQAVTPPGPPGSSSSSSCSSSAVACSARASASRWARPRSSRPPS